MSAVSQPDSDALFTGGFAPPGRRDSSPTITGIAARGAPAPVRLLRVFRHSDRP